MNKEVVGRQGWQNNMFYMLQNGPSPLHRMMPQMLLFKYYTRYIQGIFFVFVHIFFSYVYMLHI